MAKLLIEAAVKDAVEDFKTNNKTIDPLTVFKRLRETYDGINLTDHFNKVKDTLGNLGFKTSITRRKVSDELKERFESQFTGTKAASNVLVSGGPTKVVALAPASNEKTTIKVDNRGRILIPKALLEAIGVTGGQKVFLYSNERSGNGSATFNLTARRQAAKGPHPSTFTTEKYGYVRIPGSSLTKHKRFTVEVIRPLIGGNYLMITPRSPKRR